LKVKYDPKKIFEIVLYNKAAHIKKQREPIKKIFRAARTLDSYGILGACIPSRNI
jgi:hypothetical protein